MTCENVRDVLPEYIYEEGEPDFRKQVSEHLASCDGCREEHARLRQVKGVLDAWEAPEVSKGLADGVLRETIHSRPSSVDRIAEWIGFQPAAWRAGLSAGGGILASVLAILLVSRMIGGDVLSLRLVVVSGTYWAVAFWALFLGCLQRWERPRRSRISPAKAPDPRAVCLSVLLAMGVGGLFAYGSSALGVEPVRLLRTLAPSIPRSALLLCIFFVVGGVFSLVSQFFGVFATVRGLEGSPLIFGLAAGCVFTVVLAPAVSIVCVPFTLGVFASTFAGSWVGAVAGGTLAFRLRRRILHSAAG